MPDVADLPASPCAQAGNAAADAGASAAGLVARLEWSVEEGLTALRDLRTEGFAAVFQTMAWLEAWLATYRSGSDGDIRLVCGRLDGTLMVAIPLCVRRWAGAVVASIAAEEVSDYNHPIVHASLADRATPAFMAAVWQTAARLLVDVDYLSLRKLAVQPGEAGDAFWERAVAVETQSVHWTRLDGDWVEAGNRFFGKASRRKLQRKAKKLEAMGPLATRRIDAGDERRGAIEQMAGWKSAHLNELGLASPFHRPQFRNFLHRLACRGNPAEHRIYGFFAGEAMLAVGYLIAVGRHWLLYQTAYCTDEASRYSPGLFLLRDLLREAHAEHAEIFDFGLGNEGYKSKYCDRTMPLYRLTLPLTARGAIACRGSDLLVGCREFFKSHPLPRQWSLRLLRLLASAQSAVGRRRG